MAIERESYKGEDFTIHTEQKGRRWFWELSIGNAEINCGTAGLDDEKAAYAEARARAHSILNGE